MKDGEFESHTKDGEFKIKFDEICWDKKSRIISEINIKKIIENDPYMSD